MSENPKIKLLKERAEASRIEAKLFDAEAVVAVQEETLDGARRHAKHWEDSLAACKERIKQLEQQI